ncbi:hypothetical protein LV78_007747 [Actinosynnema pretiosum]|nr:hypothetical protein [Actinosynnema pretiosum]
MRVGEMSFHEKRTWIAALSALVGYAAYAVVVLGRAGGGPLSGVAYQWPLVWSTVLSVVVTVALVVVVSALAPKEAGAEDERDRDINRFGEHVGQGFVALGAVAALALALLDVGGFWIANAVYLALVLSAVVGAAAKLVAYRRGVHGW